MNKAVLLGMHIISLIFLAFGWIKDMLTINISAHLLVDINLFEEKRSVITTLKSLWQSSNYLPFLLIFLFGIIIPLTKSVIIFYILINKNSSIYLYKLVNLISKWAMADVFVISIFVAFLGAKAMQNTKATLETGFYFFTTYVILSSLISMLLIKLIKPNEISNT